MIWLLLPLLGLSASPAMGADVPSDDPLLALASAELERVNAELQSREEPPYWIQIGIVDRTAVQIQATHGAPGVSSVERARLGDVDLRVGSPELDNTHKLRDVGWFSEESRAEMELPLSEESPRALQTAIWRAVDDSYRAGVRRLIKVRTNDAVKVDREDQSADFSMAAPVVDVRPIAHLEVDQDAWQETVNAVSAVFLEYPDVYDSNVNFHAQEDVHYVLNTEGTRIRHTRWRVRVSVWAGTVADDGMELSVYDYVDAGSVAAMPSAKTLGEMARQVAQQVTALRAAPTVDPYVGPAILRGRAAGVFFHEILGHRVEGHRQKDEDEGQTLADKVGERIFPDFIQVHDDPTLATFGDEDLSGHYPYDDEGVAAARVDVVTDGVLQGFLLGRAPIDGFAVSNGHGRRQPGAAPVARQGNLLVEAKGGVPYTDLRGMLLDELGVQDKPYGFIFDDISGGFTFTGRATPNSYAVKPVTVWRVWADGRPDELVRGVDLIGTPLTTFSRIAAASDELQVFNGMCGAESGWVPVSAISPDLLVREVEVQRREKSNDRPPLLPPPAVEMSP